MESNNNPDQAAALLQREVMELTGFIAAKGDWPDIRALIKSGGFDPDTCLLASFIESEEGDEWGVIVSGDLKVHEWHRNTDNEPSKISWQHLTNMPNVSTRYPAIPVALKLKEMK